VGGAPSPDGCDGVQTPCTYTQIGALDINLTALVPAQTGNTTAFDLHRDMAPTIYIHGNPARASPITRQLERDFSKLTTVNPLTNRLDDLTVALADPIEMGLLHMITADPARTPSFTMFAAPDYWFVDFGSATPTEDPTAAWNHGGIQPEIGQIWLGIVGPGVRRTNDKEPDTEIEFSDHTDVRPTVLALTGLQGDHTHDGRALFEVLDSSALPESLHDHSQTLFPLGRLYKQINAPFGKLGLTSLKVSTFALASSSSNDTAYTKLEAKIAAWRSQRDSLAGRIRTILDSALESKRINEEQAEDLIEQTQALLDQVSDCATDLPECAL
jgi:hypothetical protein